MAKKERAVAYLCVFSLCALSFFSSVHAMKKMDVEKKKEEEKIPTLREQAIGKAISSEKKFEEGEKELALKIARKIKEKYFLKDLFYRSDLHRKVWNDLGNVKIGIHFIDFIESPLFKNKIKNKGLFELQGCKIGFTKLLNRLTFHFVGSDTIKLISANGIAELQEFDVDALYLSNNQLKKIPADIGKLKNLSELLLSGNWFKEFPIEIINLKKLSHLYLPNNQLEKLPADIGKLRNLEDLNLSNNQLKKLPAEIGKLELSKLNLSNNQLKELPAEIGKLENLLFLYLSNNELKKLPAEIDKLKRLFVLDVKNNFLSEREIKKLKRSKITTIWWDPQFVPPPCSRASPRA